jgi:RimJ/RimL family protein N-acetyltransferase
MEFNGVPVGVVRADFRMDHCELSWTVAPEARGKGFGKAMVAKVARSLGGNVRAEVKQTNVASQSIAQAAGLRLERSNNGVLYFSGYVY